MAFVHAEKGRCSASALTCLESFGMEIIDRILGCCHDLMTASKQKTLQKRTVESAIRLVTNRGGKHSLDYCQRVCNSAKGE